MANRLASESSAYLLQHAENPVDWWPWGEAAFKEAKRRDVPVFLSVGYSTCYWCHVMERQVFEDASLAEQMNAGFVCVKVDREELPDVDEHYMTATQVMAGQGGWPMSVFLTPTGEPFYAGTYFPPTDMPGRPGFDTLMTAITEAWTDRRDQVMQTVEQTSRILDRLSKPKAAEQDVTLDDDLLRRLVAASTSDFDNVHGGFGGAPKFPRQTLLETLLVANHHGLAPDGADDMLRRTLDAMADGGMRDHLGGGFHRYSTDARWLVPHFEIMLYDQGMLAWVYAEAFRQFEEPRYAYVARRICDFVLREMTDEGGAFFSAIDAEVDGVEGDPYTWTPAQIEEILESSEARTFGEVFGLAGGFNFADPHGPNPDTPDRNVLFLAQPSREEDDDIVSMREKVLAARNRRKQPRKDEKILLSWNGLMMRGLVHVGDVLQEPRYLQAAGRAGKWLLQHARSSHGGLLRTPGGSIDGFLDDYAHLAHACCALWQAGGDESWRDAAAELVAYLETRFEAEGGGYWLADPTADRLDVMQRAKRMTGGDNPLPAGNASAALALLELGKEQQAEQVLRAFAGQLVEHAGGMNTLLQAAIRLVDVRGDLKIEARAEPISPTDEAAGVLNVAGAQWTSPDRLNLKLRLAEGFHVYAEDGKDGKPIVLSTNHPNFARVEPPMATMGKLAGEMMFGLVFGEPASGQEIEVTVSYQACDDTRCLAPVRQVLTVRPDATAGAN